MFISSSCKLKAKFAVARAKPWLHALCAVGFFLPAVKPTSHSRPASAVDRNQDLSASFVRDMMRSEQEKTGISEQPPPDTPATPIRSVRRQILRRHPSDQCAARHSGDTHQVSAPPGTPATSIRSVRRQALQLHHHVSAPPDTYQFSTPPGTPATPSCQCVRCELLTRNSD